MATFPNLKTSAVAQYPAPRTLRYQNQAVRFLDGTEQRYRDCPGPLHSWEIRLELLDEGETAALDEFFAACQGVYSSFRFTDPRDGQVYQDCSLQSDEMELTAAADLSGTTTLTVVENRG